MQDQIVQIFKVPQKHLSVFQTTQLGSNKIFLEFGFIILTASLPTRVAKSAMVEVSKPLQWIWSWHVSRYLHGILSYNTLTKELEKSHNMVNRSRSRVLSIAAPMRYTIDPYDVDTLSITY